MKEVSEKNFGLIIAFLLPGFILLWGLSFSLDTVRNWLAKSTSDVEPSIGGFLYSTLASLGLGLIISAVRWAVVDNIHKLMGVKDPGLDFTKIRDKDSYPAYLAVIENHYRYYQYYANTLVAVAGCSVVYLCADDRSVSAIGVLLVLCLSIILFLASRDSLQKYFDRAGKALGTVPNERKS